MKKELKKKLDILDPKFRNEIEGIFDKVNLSISMLYDEATHDKKTGIHNYNFFKSVFEMEFEKARRGQQDLSLFILDLDHFKKVNDTYGHIKGDEILEKIAQILKISTRKSDVVARFGGEEFIILLTGTSLKRAKEITSRIRRSIKEDIFLKKHNVTISGGLTEYVKKDTIDKMQKRADKALYDAKNSGRDKLIAIGPNENKEFDIKEKSFSEIKLPKIKKANNKKINSELKKIF